MFSPPSEYTPKVALPYKYLRSPKGYEPNPISNPENLRYLSNTMEFPENPSALLMKCQTSIHELQIELDKSNKEKLYLQEKLENVQKEQNEMENKCAQEKFLKEKLQEEVHNLKNEKLEDKQAKLFLEEKLLAFKEKDRLFDELKSKFEDVCSENEILETNMQSLQKELGKKEELESEWDSLLGSVKGKIRILQQENEALKQDNKNFSVTIENMRMISNERENIRSVLLGKESDIEKKTKEINQLTQDLDQRTQELESIHRKFLEAQELTNERMEATQRELENQLLEQQRSLTEQFNKEFDEFKSKAQRDAQETRDLLSASETKLMKLTVEKQEMLSEIRRLCDDREKSLYNLRSEHKRRLQEREDYFDDELKKNALIMKDQNELIQSFEEKIEKSLYNQKRIEEKYQSQIGRLTEHKKELEMRLSELQKRYNKLCRSIRNEFGGENENLGSFTGEAERVKADISRVEYLEDHERADQHLSEKWQSKTNEKSGKKEKSLSASKKRLIYEPQGRYFIDKAKKLSEKYQEKGLRQPTQEFSEKKKLTSESKYPDRASRTTRYGEKSPHPNEHGLTNVNLNESRFSSGKKEIGVDNKKLYLLNDEKKTINPRNGATIVGKNERTQGDNVTPSKSNEFALQRSKIRSMYESQSTTNSSQSKDFLNKFKKVVGRLEDQLDKISTEIKVNNIAGKNSTKKESK